MGKIRRPAAAAIAALTAGALAFFGCAGGGAAGPAASSADATGGAAAQAQPVELQIYAANSLSKAMNEAQALYTEQNPHITFKETQYKGSGELIEMLAAGGEADLLITASKGTMDAAAERGHVDGATRIDLFANDLVIVSKEGSGLAGVTLEDIAAGRYAVCVGDDSVPAGNYAAQALSTVGAYESPDGKTGEDCSGKGGAYAGITPVLQASAGNVCKQAQSGDVDVAIVYSSDVFRFGGVEVVGAIPGDAHGSIVYPGAVCTQAANAEAARAFLDWCLNNPDVQAIWAKWGFEL